MANPVLANPILANPILANLRKAYGEALVEAGKKNKDVVVLEADLGKSTMSVMFKEAFPDRYFEMGIAEQNMTSTAAGFALAGKIPFTGTFAVFAAGRAYDQIRCSIAIPKANVANAALFLASDEAAFINGVAFPVDGGTTAD